MLFNDLKNSIFALCFIYFAIINIVGFSLMGIDKKRARLNRFRISELHLFLPAILGGSLGALIGMYVFRHKTRHLSFIIGIPIILILQAALLVWIHFYSPFRFIVF